MAEKSNSTEMFRAIIVIFATVSTIAFNALAAAGLVNGITPDAVSDKYPTVVTPAGYAFTIWSVIYLGMIGFSVYQALPFKLAEFRSVRTIYVLSCVLNCGWIYFWHRDQIGICLAIILALLVTLLLLCVKFKTSDSVRDALFTKVPFGVYFGWVTCAAIVNFVIFLTYSGANMSSSASTILGCVCIVAAAACAILVRWKLTNYLYPMAVAWALTAIAVKQSGNTPIVLAAAFAVVTCFVTTGSVVTNLKDSTSE